MEIKILASGSSGNAYYVSDGQTPLLLEAGIPFREIQRGLEFGLSKLGGCLISHEHGDHSRALKDMLRAGIDCYMSKGTAEALGVVGHRVNIVGAGKQFKVGSWRVLPFPTIHDAKDPLGFLLASGKDRILYATDTAYLPNRFRGLTHILIECNYSKGLLRESVSKGDVSSELKRRIVGNHLSLETLIDILKANNLSKVEGIYLLHLSATNSDAKGFKRAVEEATGKPVYIAK